MKLQSRILGICTLGLMACGTNSNSSLMLPSREELIQKKQTAVFHPTEKYFLGQVELRLDDDNSLSDVVANASARGLILSAMDKIPMQPIYLMEIRGLQSVDEAVKSLKEDRHVLAAGRTHYVTANEVDESKTHKDFKSNDPLVSTQWALHNDAQEAPGALAGRRGADISLGGVTAEGSKDTVVAIIDTGIDYTHEDLAVTETQDGRVVVKGDESNIWINPNEIPNNGINDDNNGDARAGIMFADDVYGYDFANRDGDPLDDHGHGTHVAGVIGALRNNHKGIAGINSKVSMMGLKFLAAEGGGSDFDAQMALYYLIDLKKRFPEKRFLTSNSWGAGGRSSTDGDEDDFLLMAFAEAERAGILSIAAAGNAGTSNRFSPNFPSNYSNKLTSLISVAALNNMDQLASFSSYGYDNVQVAAPGVLIMSSVPAYLYPTPYAAWSGTSMATPHVSGLAALVWSENPQMSAVEVKERIMNTVDKLPQLHGSLITSGRINVARALANDVNVSILPVPEIMPYVVESPRGNGMAGIDWTSTIKVDGAKEIAVCFSRIDLGGDFLEVSDSGYRVRDNISGTYRDHNFKNQSREVCSAPVLGDTLNLRLWSYYGVAGLQGYQTSYLKVVK